MGTLAYVLSIGISSFSFPPPPRQAASIYELPRAVDDLIESHTDTVSSTN